MKNFLLVLTVVGMLPISFVSFADSGSCDIQAGKAQYNKCVACHTLEPGVHKMGPSLHGLMGRKVGAADGFIFSYAMEQSDFVWTQKSLEKFLTSPMQMVPGTAMPFGGMRNEDQRKALICYMKQFK